MRQGRMSPEGLEKIRRAYVKDVAVRPEEEVREILSRAGFPEAVEFFQALMIRGWFARKGGR